jgi:hypothetical protein
VSRHSNEVPRVIHKFFDERTRFRCFSFEAAFKRLVITTCSKKKSRLIDGFFQDESDVKENVSYQCK